MIEPRIVAQAPRDSFMTRILSDLFDTDIKLIDGGFLVRDTGTVQIHVMRQLVNWRVGRLQKDLEEYDRAWCFYGTGVVTLIRATGAAVSWDGADDTAPDGWDKNVFTGEYSHPKGPRGI